MSLNISNQVTIPLSEIQFQAIRAQGAGGQNVNKVSSAIHLRFDIKSSSLPAHYKERLLQRSDKRITGEGIVIIKAQRHRSQEKNRADALARLQSLVKSAGLMRKSRKSTRPTRGSQLRRVDSKTKRGKLKNLRGKIEL